MSQSTQGYTGFAAHTSSERGIARQNDRIRPARMLRLLLVCTLFFALPAVSFAQPPDYLDPNNPSRWDGMTWVDWAPIAPAYPQGEPPQPGWPVAWAPYPLLFVTLDNVTGTNRYMSASMNGNMSLSGQVYSTGNRSTTWWIGTMGSVGLNGTGANVLTVTGTGNINSLYELVVQGSVTNAGSISNLAYLTVFVNASNSGTINLGGGSYFNVANQLSNANSGTISATYIGATNITNLGTISGFSTLTASGYLINSQASPGGNYTPPSVITGTSISVGPGTGVVDGSPVSGFINYYGGDVYSVSLVNVYGTLHNQGMFRGISTINTENIINDGRIGSQGGASWYRGLLLDVNYINTAYDLTNWGANAVINGAYRNWGDWNSSGESGGTGMIGTIHVGGNLNNLDRATLMNYANIMVEGSLDNRGSTLVGGHWYVHNTSPTWDNHGLLRQIGYVSINGNILNHTEWNAAEMQGYGGLIANFDTFTVHGSVFNDANSTISGSYTHYGTAPSAGWNWEWNGSGDPGIIYPAPDGEHYLPGRRAAIANGMLLLDGEYDSAASRLIIGAHSIINSDLAPVVPVTFSGLYSAGHIREIDLIHVGTTEADVLWNALPVGYDPRALMSYGPRDHYAGNFGWDVIPNTVAYTNTNAPSTITDIGIINAMNLINQGTISDIDVAINVSYVLFNDEYGIIDGLSTERVESWTYPDVPTSILRPTMNIVQEVTRANLIVGRSESSFQNPVSQFLGGSVAGMGLINFGTISNFQLISSAGDLYNAGAIGVPVMTNAGLTGGVTAIVVGSNMDSSTRADMYNFGILQNIEGITVTGDLYLGSGSSLNVGTLTAGYNVIVSGTVDGGFRILSANREELVVDYTGDLTVARGSVASGNSAVLNYGSIVNNGLLHSAVGIENWGVIENSGMIDAYNSFLNQGTISGSGIVFLNSQTGVFENAANGVISGGLTISGNFRNYNGTIIVNDTNEIIRITDNGLATAIGGLVDARYSNPVIGEQYMFMAAENAGDLHISQDLRGLGSGDTGSVLDLTPLYGYWDGTKYVQGKEWSRNNQYYWVEFQRAYSYGAHGRTDNQIAIGTYIDTISAAPVRDSSLWNLLVRLDGISDDPTNPHFNPDYKAHQGDINPAAYKALNELAGFSYANLGVASVHNIGVVNRSLADVLRSDVFKFSFVGNPNNAIRGQAIAPLRYTRWGTLFGIGGTSASDGNASGYRQSFGGVMAGMDRALWTGTRIGGWVSAATGEVKMSRVAESTDITNVMVGMYLRQEMYYGYGLVSAGFGVDNYKTTRNLTMIGHRAESKFNGHIGTMYLERGIDIPVYYATLQPYTNFQVASISREKFTERMWDHTGQYTDIGLVGKAGTTNSYRMAIGTRMSSAPVALPWGQVALTANTAWFHEFNKQKDWNYEARFNNPGESNFGPQFSDASFKVTANNPKQDWCNFGFGLNIDRNSTRLFLGADLFANGRQTLFSGSGGFSTAW